MPRLSPLLIFLSLPFTTPFQGYPSISASAPPSVSSSSFPSASPLSSPSTNCTTLSLTSWSWSLSDIYFHSSVIFSTPSHQIEGAWVSFTLTHPALPGVEMACEASSTHLQDWFYGDEWYTCVPSADAEGEGGARGSRARFTFERVGGWVGVEYQWACWEDPDYPAFFEAKGNGTAKLGCQETRWTSTNWTQGQIYSTDTVECAKANLTIAPFEIRAVS